MVYFYNILKGWKDALLVNNEASKVAGISTDFLTILL